MPRHNKSEKCHHEHYDKKDRHKEHDRHRSDQHHHQQQGNADGSGGMAGGFMKDMLEGAARGAGSAIARRAVAYALSGSAGAMEGAKSGQFDIYLFAQSWAPRFCCSQKEKCESQGIQDTPGLSTHGLWPSFIEPKTDGKTFPAFCVKSPKTEGEFDLAEHEWKKHGTCTRLARDKYFEEEHRIAQHLAEIAPLAMVEKPGVPIDILEIRTGYPRAVGLQLDDLCRLKEVTTCFAKESDGTVGEQVDCPDHVLEGSRNRVGDCQQLYLDKPGTCAYISKQLINSMKAL